MTTTISLYCRAPQKVLAPISSARTPLRGLSTTSVQVGGARAVQGCTSTPHVRDGCHETKLEDPCRQSDRVPKYREQPYEGVRRAPKRVERILQKSRYGILLFRVSSGGADIGAPGGFASCANSG